MNKLKTFDYKAKKNGYQFELVSEPLALVYDFWIQVNLWSKLGKCIC